MRLMMRVLFGVLVGTMIMLHGLARLFGALADDGGHLDGSGPRFRL
jgi:hypothetical protein